MQHELPVKTPVSAAGPDIRSFSPEVLREHRLLRTSLWSHIRDARLLVTLTVPLIYACLAPFALLDLFVSFFQRLCFPIYRIPKVGRRDYLIFDRGRLAYLNGIEKVGCVYCSYANGLLAYTSSRKRQRTMDALRPAAAERFPVAHSAELRGLCAEIAARTEKRFCPIRHARPEVSPLYAGFVPYGGARGYRARWK